VNRVIYSTLSLSGWIDSGEVGSGLLWGGKSAHITHVMRLTELSLLSTLKVFGPISWEFGPDDGNACTNDLGCDFVTGSCIFEDVVCPINENCDPSSGECVEIA